MKKFICVVGFAMVAGLLFAQVNERGNKNFTGEVNIDGDWKIKGTKVNVTAAELNQLDSGAALSVGSIAVSGNANVTGSITGGTATVTGKSTLNGELEVNQASVDINLKATADVVDIAQTNTAGTASTPLINVNDDRTGTTANEASEASIYIDADGTYGLAVADGKVQIEAEIDTAAGDILLTPAGGEVHINGGLHVGGTDAVGDNNLKVDGTLTQVGTATFTLAPVMTALTASKPVFTDGSKLLTSSGTIGVDQGGSGAATFTDNGVLIGNAANAFSVTAVGTDGQVFLGATGANPTWGTMGGDASIAANGTVTVSKGLAITNGASLIGIPTAGLTLGGANIKSMLDCADYSAVRTALSLRPGTEVQAYAADLDTLALNNGGSLTNLQAATALIGVVPLANGGAGNASGILKANGAGLVSAASSTTDYIAPIAQVSGVTTAALVATVTFQSSITGPQHLTGWLSESAGGVAVGTNVVSIADGGNTTVLAGGGAGDAYAVWVSHTDGLSTLDITMTGAQSGLYFNTVQHNGVVVSTPAFNVAP
jgi:cytoskeletal protein CcmA (bactofilin family)